MTQLIHRVLLLLSFGVSSLAAEQAEGQCSKTSVMVLLVDGTTIPLSQTKTERIPYGRDLTVLIRTDPAVSSVVVEYDFSGGSEGPRTGRAKAVQDKTGKCWAAALPRVHLNETGSLTAVLSRPPVFKTGQSSETFTVSVLLKLAALPSGLSPEDFSLKAGDAVSQAITEAYATPADSLFVSADETTWESLQRRLAQTVASEIQFTNVFSDVRNQAKKLERAMPGALKDSSLASRSLVGCVSGSTLGELQASAAILKDASDEALAERIVKGALPWPPCAMELVKGVGDAGDPRRVADAVDQLVNAQQLRFVLLLATQVRSLAKEVSKAETLEVPLGADLLERYTQVDVVSAYIPSQHVTQAFAAATWYFFNPKASYTAKIQPTGVGGNRFGIQVGYPVGTISKSKGSFEPDILVGVIGRINGVLSGSLGVVFGKDSLGKDKRPVFVSFNVDLSNLGPLQQLFSRRDK